MKRFGIFIVYLSTIFSVYAKVELPSIWGSNMVLQQQAVIIFRGKANANKKVYVQASWNKDKIYTQADKDGYWALHLPTPKAGGPFSLTFSDGEELVLSNILIGEVWFCCGQSNMEMPVKGFRGQPVYGSQSYIVSATPKRHLRLYTVENAWSTRPQSQGRNGSWVETTSEEIANFSATAFFFGNLLQKTLDIPVGLINCSWSASKIEAWMSKEALSGIPEVELPDVNQSEFGWPAGTPTLLWNAMVNPWKGFPIKGVIWYQGEANSSNPSLYKKLFPAMVEQWRTFFQSDKLPFYYVQIAPWQSEGSDKLDWAWFRQCQLELMFEVPHTGMAITTDAGSEKFIHPPHKIKVGQRLAYWALAQTYGKKGFSYSGPIHKTAQCKDSIVEITFEFAENGLIPENQRLKGFEIAGQDGLFLSAEAEIINGSARVNVWHPEVTHPKEVRYCFRNYMEGNLLNNAELPAAPFRVVLE